MTKFKAPEILGGGVLAYKQGFYTSINNVRSAAH